MTINLSDIPVGGWVEFDANGITARGSRYGFWRRMLLRFTRCR